MAVGGGGGEKTTITPSCIADEEDKSELTKEAEEVRRSE